MAASTPFPSATWPASYPAHGAVAGDVARLLDARAEREFLVPSLVLMEHASLGVAHVAAHLAAGGPILVLCGPGNNGGDGYGAARFLASWGLPVRILGCSPRPPRRPDAAREVALARQEVPIEDAWGEPALVARALQGASVAVDALFGVGLDRNLDPPYGAWIEALNAAGGLKLAVDVPSGLDADTGAVRPVAVRADVTATMGMPKTGFAPGSPGAAYAGQVVEIDIGLPGPLHRPYLR